MDPMIRLLPVRLLARRRRRTEVNALRIRQRQLRDASDPYALPELNIRGRYRLSRELARALTEEVRHLMGRRVRTTAIPVELRVLSALHFFAQGSYQKGVGNDCNAPMSQTAVSNCIEELTAALNTPQILSRHMKLPQSEVDIGRTIHKNYQRYLYIPGVLGMVDGAHFFLQTPLEHEELFVNRKGLHSMNVQICCDVDFVIQNVLAIYPGSTHDSFNWSNSALKNRMETLYRAGNQCWLLGDSGYPHEPWLQKPILNAEEGSRELNYTYAHMIIRSSVERCIGHLRARFRCVNKHRVLHYAPEKAGRIINSVSVLHNMCVRANVSVPDSDSDSDSDDDNENEDVGVRGIQANVNQNLLGEAQLLRNRFVQRTAVVPPANRPERRIHRRGQPAVRLRGHRRN